MQIYNSMTRKKETFKPIHEGKVGIYACGPTVYNYFHIGNARPFITFDVLRRQLEREGYQVTFVQNFTDIDDKMIKRANEEGITVKELADRFIKEYYTDAQALGIRPATVHPKATDHIPEIISLIQKLIDNGHAYAVPSGDVYYRVSAFPGYGKLSGQSVDDRETGASERLNVETDKESPEDFALWKAQKPGEPAWESPWGMGRPGWHIECSAMSMKYLGENFDIHCGGKDLLFPHHENEIAQSEGATGKKYVNYWMHNGFINVDNQKMSKSLNNFFTVRDIAKEYDLEAVRLFNARNSLKFQLENGEDRPLNEEEKAFTERLKGYEKRFDDAMDDDMNTADALGAIFELVKDANVTVTHGASREAAKAALDSLEAICDVLGILTKKEEELPAEIAAMVQERAEARKNKDWAKSDELRDRIIKAGYILEDTKQGQKVRKDV